MVEQILASHSILVKIFLGLLVAGLLVPMLTAKDPLSFKKFSFIYTMFFQAIITMIAFTGLIAMVMGEFGFTPSIIIMIVIWAVLMYIEIRKYRLIKMAKIQNEDTHKLLNSAFLKISAVQILLVAIMVLLMVLKVKGVISL